MLFFMLCKERLFRYLRINYGINNFSHFEDEAPLSDGEVEQIIRNFERSKILKILSYDREIFEKDASYF
jgi:hypothetical protein